jgi:hypothetical protein
MIKQTLDTEIVFRDLKEANKKLQLQTKNPNAVRQRFSEFVTLSQKLTEVMRKEYSALTLQKWEPKIFSGWTSITTLFKELRNADYHQNPIRIIMHQIHESRGVESSIDKEGNIINTPVQLDIKVVYSPEAGLKKKLPNPCSYNVIDTNGQQSEPIPILAVRFEFHLEGRTPAIENILNSLETRDIHILAKQGYATFSNYYEFYKIHLTVNRKVL